MDMLMLGETVCSDDSGGTYTGFWMPAGGNDGVAAIEVFLISGAGDWTVVMETKSSDQDDSGAAPIATPVSVSSVSPPVTRFDVAGAKDLVRYKIAPEEGTVGFIHFQLCQPLWAPN